MISFVRIYDDELLYSVFSRFHLHSGNLTYTDTARSIFRKPTAKISKEFFNEYSDKLVFVIERDTNQSIYDFIINHSLIKHYARFYRDRKSVIKAVSDMDTAIINHLPTPQRGTRFLRYCALCAREQRAQFGECFFTCSANLYGVNVCAKHKCKLKSTNILIDSKLTPAFITAEEIIPENEDVEMAENNVEVKFAEYVNDVFNYDFTDTEQCDVGKYLKQKLTEPYIGARGEKMRISKFWDDFLSYYNGVDLCGLSEKWQLTKIFSDQRLMTHEICLVGQFEGLQSGDLAEHVLTDTERHIAFDTAIRRYHEDGLNYRQIAEMLNASYDYVKRRGKR